MRFRDALKWSLQYHSLAVFPTLLVRTQSQAVEAALADATGDSASAATNGEVGADSEFGPDSGAGVSHDSFTNSGSSTASDAETGATDAEYDEFGYGSDDTGVAGT